MIDTQNADVEMAPCLGEGPFAEAGRSFVEGTRALGRTRAASVMRGWLVVHIFQHCEAILASDREPVAEFRRLLEDCARLFHDSASSSFIRIGEDAEKSEAQKSEAIEAVTGEHYGSLFKGFSAESYWEEPLRLLRIRLERNGVEAASFEGKSLLDAGCGGGRYAAAWRALGARPVTGVDVSPTNIADARCRTEAAGAGVEFRVADVLDLPFEDDFFDVVFSNGVLHHTRDCERGAGELVRVLKPGGFGWLYLIEKPGGLFWDSIEILRVVMRDEKGDTARAALQILGLPANRIFYMLDHVMVPINRRLEPAEVERYLRRAGAIQIRRLSRGADFDRIERISRGCPFAEAKYGVGENRYVFSKE